LKVFHGFSTKEKLKRKILRILTFILLLIITFRSATAQTPLQWIKKYPRHYVKSLGHIFDVQYHQKVLLSGAALLPVAFLLDDPIQEYASEHGLYSDDISLVGDLYGHRWGYYLALSSVVVYDAFKKPLFPQTFCDLELIVETTLTNATLTAFFKSLFHRQRPNQKGFRSFPSGHTSGSFALAACLDHLYGRKVGVPAYLMAAFVASSRINDNKHYLSDVVAGAVLGTVVGRSFAREHHTNWNTQLQLNANQGVSLNISYSLDGIFAK